MSLADYIMGVPSTFSMWASFYGKVPLRILQYKDEKVQLNQFSAIVSQNEFENGIRFEHKTKSGFHYLQGDSMQVEHLDNRVFIELDKPEQQKVNS